MTRDTLNRLLRSTSTVAAGIWLGGMILIAIVAQTTFSEIRLTELASPNAIAGRVMARNFVRFDRVQWVCVSVVAACQLIRMAMGSRGRVELVRLLLAQVAAALFVYSALVMTPRILGMQSIVAGPAADLEIKRLFDSFHQTSVLISKINLFVIAGLAFSLAWPSSVNATSTVTRRIDEPNNVGGST